MKFSPIYVHYLSEIIGLVITKAIMVGIDARDQNQLVLAALALMDDPDSRQAVLDKLQDKGDLICGIWQHYCAAVSQHNATGVAQNALNINALIERMKNHADRG